MKITINFNDFERAFQRYNRDNNFSFFGLQVLFNYLEDLESDMAEDMELDVIGLCCEYTEYESLQIFQDEHGKEYESIEDIENQTIVIPINEESFIVGNF